MNGIIDPCCSDGVNKATMQYVKDEINRAVFEAGTCTPDSVQAQIDGSLENYASKKYVDDKFNKVYYKINDLEALPDGFTINDILSGKLVLYYQDSDLGRLSLPMTTILKNHLPNKLSYECHKFYASNLYINYEVKDDGSITHYYTGKGAVLSVSRTPIASTQKEFYNLVKELAHTSSAINDIDFVYIEGNNATYHSIYRGVEYKFDEDDNLRIVLAYHSPTPSYREFVISPEGVLETHSGVTLPW